MHATLVTLGRILLGLFFVVSALLKIKSGADAGSLNALAGYIGSRNLPSPQIIAYFVVAFELVCGLALVIGYFTTPVSLLLALFCLATAVLFHNFWAVPAEQMQGQINNFLKNIALTGAFLVLAGEGMRMRTGAAA